MTPTLLVPGLLCTSEIFAPQLPSLWAFGAVMVARPEGRSITEMAERILRSAPPRFNLAGVSMGGYVCFEIVRRAPERVLRLALLDTSARPESPEARAARQAAIAAARTGDFRALLERGAEAALHPEHRTNPELVSTIVRMGEAVGPDLFVEQSNAVIERPDARADLPDITVPTLVMVGDADQMTPVDLSEEIAAAIHGAKLIIVRDAGHGATLEQPEAVNAALGDWLMRPAGGN